MSFAVRYMYSVFHGSTNLAGDVALWNTSQAIHMDSVFRGAQNLAVDVKDWDRSSVTIMSRLFWDT